MKRWTQLCLLLVGLLAALLEAGLPPSAVAGSSSGALVASLHAAGLSMEEDYLGVLRRLAQSGVLRLARPWEEPGGLFSLRCDGRTVSRLVPRGPPPIHPSACIPVPLSVLGTPRRCCARSFVITSYQSGSRSAHPPC